MQTLREVNLKKGISKNEASAVLYHGVFDYPLTASELIKWTCGTRLAKRNIKLSWRSGYYFVSGSSTSILKRKMRGRISARKILIARRAAKILRLVPFVRFVAITGSLAMKNSSDESDIDLMIIAKRNRLWTTRVVALGLLALFGVPVRRTGDKMEKNKLCLNLWFDESDLVWGSPKNTYTAHEISQIIPLVNKDRLYERFISANKWIKRYWPNATKDYGLKTSNCKKQRLEFIGMLLNPVEYLARTLQFAKMKKKITRETVTATRAVFHPIDWSKLVEERILSMSLGLDTTPTHQ